MSMFIATTDPRELILLGFAIGFLANELLGIAVGFVRARRGR